MTEEKKYTLQELKNKLTKKERVFCHQYIIDWNGSRSAKDAGYSEKTRAVIANENLTKPYIKQYIDFIKNDLEKEAGLSKLKQINSIIEITQGEECNDRDKLSALAEVNKMMGYLAVEKMNVDNNITITVKREKKPPIDER